MLPPSSADEIQLSGSHELFCQEYTRHNNAAKAYRAAYPECSQTSAPAAGSRLLTNVNVLARVEELRSDLIRKSRIGREQVVSALVEIGFSDLGSVLPTTSEKIRALEILARMMGFFEQSGSNQPNDEDPLRELSSALAIFEGRLHMKTNKV